MKSTFNTLSFPYFYLNTYFRFLIRLTERLNLFYITKTENLNEMCIKSQLILYLLINLLFVFPKVFAQQTTLTEKEQSFKTYPYSDPNPVPVLGINKKVAPFYPYFDYDGYTDKSITKDWKVVTLSNPYITVTVLPEVGGKVLGAEEKSTGNEFVYLNHVMKFRAIGIRGPWTSGGIEHNFGLDLGHAPWAAGPVDYKLIVNPDSSVSCVVGGLDLASRSEWRVNIRLPKDKALFETESLWYNPTPLHHAHLSWENAAFKATNDLQFYFPGNYHIGHDGLASPWPVDKDGHRLDMYRENNFGDSKSYHVVGNYRNWFGGYWHDKQFGFGHWAPYSDASGKKLWIWSLSREGAIWENLLTDNDGQYIEAQSGVKLNQAAERSGFHSPFMQLYLRPLYAETKREYWFPVKGTDGMADATAYGTLQVTRQKDSLIIAISPTVKIDDSLVVSINNKTVYAAALRLQPMQKFKQQIALPTSTETNAIIHVRVGHDKLLYSSDKKEYEVQRPVSTPATGEADNAAQRLFRMAEDENAMRNYKLALQYYEQCLQAEPTHSEALSRVAEYYYRSGQYEQGLGYARKALQYNTYDGSANYMYGNLLRRLGQLPQATEAFSTAVLTIEYRSAAYVALSGIGLQQGSFDVAADNALRALDYNKNNLLAYQFLATAYRKMNQPNMADSILQVLLTVDPLNHYAEAEQYFLKPSAAKLQSFKSNIKNELPHETYLELAVTYANQGLDEEAIAVLKEAPAYPAVYYWLAYLLKNKNAEESHTYLQKAMAMSPSFVFPFRLEEIPVLNWALSQSASWKTNYYLGLVYWNNLRSDKAKELFRKCGNEPDFAPFYLARGALFGEDSLNKDDIGKDYERAISLAPGEWRTWHYRTTYLLNNSRFEEMCANAKQSYSKFTTNPVVAMDYAKSLLNTKRLEECLQVLNKALVLPQEGAQEGHEIYELANLASALKLMEQKKYKAALTAIGNSRKWPENLGTGSPYNPDERLQNVMANYCEHKLGNTNQALTYDSLITAYSLNAENWNNTRNAANNYIGIRMLNKENKQQTTQLMSEWKNKQDSLYKWNIAAGSAAPEFQWVTAKYNGDEEKAAQIEKELLADGVESRFRITIKALQTVSK